MKKIDGYEICRITALVILLFIGPLILFKPAYDYTLIKNITGLLFSILLSALFIIQKRSFEFEKKSLLLFSAFALWILFSSLTASIKHGAAKALEDYLLYFLIFICSMNIDLKKRDIYIWLSSGFITSVIALFNYLGPTRYAISTFGNPNFFAGHIIMLISISFAMLFIKENTKTERQILFLFTAIALLSLLLARSRAAILSSFLGMATVLFLTGKGKKFLRRWGGYLFFLMPTFSFSPLIFYWIRTNIRMYIWRGTVEMIKVKPWTGWGLGAFPFFYPYFRIKEYFLQLEATPVTIHVHNEYLQLWAETGIIGLLLFLGLLIVIVLNGSKKMQESNGWERFLMAGCISGIISVLADNLFSTNMRNPSTSMYLWFLAGLLAGAVKNRQISFGISKKLWYTTGIAAFIMCVFTSFYRIMPEIYLKRGVWAKEVNNMSVAIENYSLVCALNPYNYEAWYKLAFVYGESGRLEKAEEIYTRINRLLFPHFAKTDANLGTVYIKQGDIERGLYYYKWAEWFNPYDIDILCSTASLYLTFYNNIPKAVDYLQKVLTINPKNGYANRIMNLLKAEGKI